MIASINFRKAQNILHRIPGKKEFILESEAEALLQNWREKILSHPSEEPLD